MTLLTLSERVDMACVLAKGVLINRTAAGTFDAISSPGSMLGSYETQNALLVFYLAICTYLLQASTRPLQVARYLPPDLPLRVPSALSLTVASGVVIRPSVVNFEPQRKAPRFGEPPWRSSVPIRDAVYWAPVGLSRRYLPLRSSCPPSLPGGYARPLGALVWIRILTLLIVLPRSLPLSNMSPTLFEAWLRVSAFASLGQHKGWLGGSRSPDRGAFQSSQSCG